MVNDQIRFEMLAGLALSYHAVGDYTRAISKGTELYGFQPIFEFTYDLRINYVDIVVLVAASHYAQGSFSEALIWVQKLEADFSVDVSTTEGRAELIIKIEALQNL